MIVCMYDYVCMNCYVFMYVPMCHYVYMNAHVVLYVCVDVCTIRHIDFIHKL